MKAYFNNPYAADTDQHFIWEVLVKNDFEGFLANDWEMVADDYLEEGFFGIDFAKTDVSRNWKLNFPTLAHYQRQWLKDASEFQTIEFLSDPRVALYKSCKLEQVDIQEDTAMVHKVFAGGIPVAGGPDLELRWRSLFLMRKRHGAWKIAGFCGYIKLDDRG